MKAVYIFIVLCFLMLAWVGLTAIFDKDYPIDTVMMRKVAR